MRSRTDNSHFFHDFIQLFINSSNQAQEAFYEKAKAFSTAAKANALKLVLF